MGTVHRLEFKPIGLCKSIASKNIQSDIAVGSSGSRVWTRVKRERTKARERLLRTILFYSGHLQHERERPGMERKHMNTATRPNEKSPS